MKVTTQFTNLNASQSLSNFAKKKAECLLSYSDNIIDVTFIFTVANTTTKTNKETKININISGEKLVCKKTCKSFEEGMCIAIESMKRKLSKIKQKQNKRRLQPTY
jgi:putative sigma-54 modulation protein